MTQQRQTLQSITRKQQHILEYIFRYRFITINHLRTFFIYKNNHYIQTLLNDLVSREYIYRDYSPETFKASQTPAIYYLATPGIRYLRETGVYPEVELQNRYKDRTRTPAFIDHCLLIADCAVNLQDSSDDTVTYSWLTQSDVSSLDDESPEAIYLRELRPHLYFTKQTNDKTVSYVVEHMHTRLPHRRLRSRLEKLIKFEAYEWSGEGQSPSTLIMCDELADLVYVKRRSRFLIGRDYDADMLDIRAATTKEVRVEGISGRVWEAAL